MSSGEKPVSASASAAFSTVVDETCERLMDRQIQYSIRRIHEMENRLAVLEQELDAFLFSKDGK
ncbi:MAG TPA: hypothetical protein DEQ14_08150 [Treponema sp.]|nr:hypothetical protein [Treponema sp.]